MTELTLLPSSERSSSGAGPAVDLGPRGRLLVQTLAVEDGEPDVWLEASANSASGWTRFASFPDDAPTFLAPARYVRVAWELDAPSTFGVSGTTGTVFATLEQLYEHGRREDALSDVPLGVRVRALVTASAKANSALALRYDLPIVAWPDDLSEAVAKIAAYDLLSHQGFNPEGGDANIRVRHDDGMGWLIDVANGKLNPVGLIDSTPEIEDDGVVVASSPRRGW